MVISLLKDAFADDVLFKTVFNGDNNAMEKYITLAVEACEKNGGVISIDNQAVITWVSEKGFPPSIAQETLSEHEKDVINRFEIHEHTPETIISGNAENFGYIWFLAVSEKARGKGLAKQLIEKAVEDMKLKGLTECWLSTENPANKNFYSHNGFTLVKEKLSDMQVTSMVFMKKI